jgi:hypothetical protein
MHAVPRELRQSLIGDGLGQYIRDYEERSTGSAPLRTGRSSTPAKLGSRRSSRSRTPDRRTKEPVPRATGRNRSNTPSKKASKSPAKRVEPSPAKKVARPVEKAQSSSDDDVDHASVPPSPRLVFTPVPAVPYVAPVPSPVRVVSPLAPVVSPVPAAPPGVGSATESDYGDDRSESDAWSRNVSIEPFPIPPNFSEISAGVPVSSVVFAGIAVFSMLLQLLALIAQANVLAPSDILRVVQPGAGLGGVSLVFMLLA